MPPPFRKMSTDSIIAQFPHQTISPIPGRPEYNTIAALHRKLNANAAAVFSSRGDGRHGHLALTVSDAHYLTTTGVPFIPPTNPGIHPTIALDATTAEIAHANRQHEALQREWRTWISTENSLRSQVLGAIDELYVHTLSSTITGFTNVTVRQLLQHLYSTYGRIDEATLQENDAMMKKDFDHLLPFEHFVKQIEDSMELAEAANTPYTSQQVILIGYNIMFKTGVFTDECKAWRKKPISTKTWANMKLHFAEAFRELHVSSTTASSAGYNNSANMIQVGQPTHEGNTFQEETATALANLAEATAADRTTVQEIANANSALVKQLSSVTASLNTALQELALIRKQATPTVVPSKPNIPGVPKGRTPPRTVRCFQNKNYFFSYGCT